MWLFVVVAFCVLFLLVLTFRKHERRSTTDMRSNDDNTSSGVISMSTDVMDASSLVYDDLKETSHIGIQTSLEPNWSKHADTQCDLTELSFKLDEIQAASLSPSKTWSLFQKCLGRYKTTIVALRREINRLNDDSETTRREYAAKMAALVEQHKERLDRAIGDYEKQYRNALERAAHARSNADQLHDELLRTQALVQKFELKLMRENNSSNSELHSTLNSLREENISLKKRNCELLTENETKELQLRELRSQNNALQLKLERELMTAVQDKEKLLERLGREEDHCANLECALEKERSINRELTFSLSQSLEHSNFVETQLDTCEDKLKRLENSGGDSSFNSNRVLPLDWSTCGSLPSRHNEMRRSVGAELPPSSAKPVASGLNQSKTGSDSGFLGTPPTAKDLDSAISDAQRELNFRIDQIASLLPVKGSEEDMLLTPTSRTEFDSIKFSSTHKPVIMAATSPTKSAFSRTIRKEKRSSDRRSGAGDQTVRFDQTPQVKDQDLFRVRPADEVTRVSEKWGTPVGFLGAPRMCSSAESIYSPNRIDLTSPERSRALPAGLLDLTPISEASGLGYKGFSDSPINMSGTTITTLSKETITTTAHSPLDNYNNNCSNLLRKSGGSGTSVYCASKQLHKIDPELNDQSDLTAVQSVGSIGFTPQLEDDLVSNCSDRNRSESRFASGDHRTESITRDDLEDDAIVDESIFESCSGVTPFDAIKESNSSAALLPSLEQSHLSKQSTSSLTATSSEKRRSARRSLTYLEVDSSPVSHEDRDSNTRTHVVKTSSTSPLVMNFHIHQSAPVVPASASVTSGMSLPAK